MLVSFLNSGQTLKFKSPQSKNETINYNNKLLKQPYNDTFAYNKQNLAFTSHLPKEELLQLCDEAIEQLNKLKNTEHISELAKKIRLKKNSLFENSREYIKNNFPEEHNDAAKFFHECDNKFLGLDSIEMNKFQKFKIRKNHGIGEQSNDTEYVPFFKKIFNETIESARKSVATRETLEKMEKNPNTPVNMCDLMLLLKELSYKEPDSFIIKNEHLLDGKTTLNPKKLYDNVLSQLWLNAKKYIGNEPFIVEIEKNKSNKLYMTFLNPDTTPLSNSEIDEIVKGNMYRATATKDKVVGTGLGYKNIIAELKENRLDNDILNLIEKDRKQGFKVRVPLVGVE